MTGKTQARRQASTHEHGKQAQNKQTGKGQRAGKRTREWHRQRQSKQASEQARCKQTVMTVRGKPADRRGIASGQAGTSITQTKANQTDRQGTVTKQTVKNEQAKVAIGKAAGAVAAAATPSVVVLCASRCQQSATSTGLARARCWPRVTHPPPPPRAAPAPHTCRGCRRRAACCLHALPPDHARLLAAFDEDTRTGARTSTHTFTHKHARTHTKWSYLFICLCVCVCACTCVCLCHRKRERQ